MSSATVRPKGGRKQDGGYQPFSNSNQSRTSRKWNNVQQHPVNNAPRNQIPQNNQSSNNNHSNNNTSSSGTNSLKPTELVHDEVSANHVNHMHDRMLFLLSNLVGINVVVTIKSGVRYQGLFHAAHTEGELGVILKLARKVVTKPEEKNQPNRVIPVFILPYKEVMEIHACGVDFSASLDKSCGEREGFRTDADIGGRTEIRERELHKWASEESGETMKGLEDDINPESTDASWDQFAANEKLFGIKTDFNEELYTTKLDRSRADFKERERQAIAIANEITRTSTTNIHVLEERGYLVEESQMDEEERYGAVVRNRDPSKYMPPALRKLQEQQQLQQHGTAPAVKKPETVKEPIKDVKTKPTEEPQNIKPVPPSAVPVPPSPSISKPSPFTPLPLASFRVEPDVTSVNSASKKPDTDADGRPIEAQIVKTFRKFANYEKERLQQRKQAIFKKEMDGKMAELLKWGKNFKLTSPIPQDLIPIITRDETKRQQLAAKSAAAISEKENDKEKEKLKEKEKEKEKQESEKGNEKDDDKPKEKTNSTPCTDSKTEILKPIIKIEEDKPQSNGESKSVPEKVTSDKSTSAADKAPPQLPPSRTLSTTPTNTQFKLNAKASEWKPNPNATPNNAGEKRSPGSSPFFGNRQLKKNSASLKDGFSPFKKGKPLENPNSITPTWPFGQKPFRHHFTVPSNYEEDIYAQASVSQGFGFATYPVTPYRFTAGTQFVVPPMPIQQTTPMQYMPGFAPGMPFTTAPMPPNGAPPTIYSPPIPPVIPQHFGSQGFPSPGRTQIVPTGMHPQIYPPYQSPHGIPPMMHYPREMVHHVPPGGVMMGQRPMMIEQHYETAPMEVMPVSDQTTAQ